MAQRANDFPAKECQEWYIAAKKLSGDVPEECGSLKNTSLHISWSM